MFGLRTNYLVSDIRKNYNNVLKNFKRGMLNLLEKYRVYLIYVPLVLYGIILVILTILPGNDAVKSNSPDKFYHFGVYGLLSLILYFTLYFQNKILLLKNYPAAFTLLFASLFGILNETVLGIISISISE